MRVPGEATDCDEDDAYDEGDGGGGSDGDS